MREREIRDAKVRRTREYQMNRVERGDGNQSVFNQRRRHKTRSQPMRRTQLRLPKRLVPLGGR